VLARSTPSSTPAPPRRKLAPTFSCRKSTLQTTTTGAYAVSTMASSPGPSRRRAMKISVSARPIPSTPLASRRSQSAEERVASSGMSRTSSVRARRTSPVTFLKRFRPRGEIASERLKRMTLIDQVSAAPRARASPSKGHA
jgi:hypothetical protein